jgi:hypothetical protein
VCCDNISVVYLTQNSVYRCRTKHIELDIHFVRNKAPLCQLRVLHVSTSQQLVEIMTKGLPSATFEVFSYSLCVASEAWTAWAIGISRYVFYAMNGMRVCILKP